MEKNTHLILLAALLLSACNQKANKATLETWKQEILAVEKEFMDMTKDHGLAAAFLYYAADTAVLKRGNKLIIGKQAIAKNYEQQSRDTSIRLVWEPDFVDVSASGDMAYTYGEYTYSFIDSLGVKQASKGIFHTVWKRQSNGEWKYVFD